MIKKESKMSKVLYHIVLVEDDFTFGSSLVELLEVYGFKVKWFRNSLDAFSWITMVKSTDIIITDVMMPNLDGKEFGVELQKITEINQIPIVYITALSKDAEQLKGIDPFFILQKPFHIEELIEMITPLLNAKHMLPLEETKKTFELMMDRFFASDQVLKMVSTRLQMDESEFFNWVLLNYGLNFVDYLEKVRVKKALLMIKFKKRNYQAIAIECGFLNEEEFSTIFKKHLGFNPELY